MNNVCPCCKRALPRTTAKSSADKKLAQDTARAQEAIESLRRFIHGGYADQCAREYCTYPPDSQGRTWSGKTNGNPHTLIVEAAELEINRLENAILFPAILWRIYRRADKGESYVRVVTEAIEVAA